MLSVLGHTLCIISAYHPNKPLSCSWIYTNTHKGMLKKSSQTHKELFVRSYEVLKIFRPESHVFMCSLRVFNFCLFTNKDVSENLVRKVSPKPQTMSLLSSKTRYFKVHSMKLLLWWLATRYPRLIEKTFNLLLSGGRSIWFERCIEIYSWRKLYETYVLQRFHFMWRGHTTIFLETHYKNSQSVQETPHRRINLQ